MKVACAAMSVPGHAFPMLAVARALALRGHEVTFFSGARNVDEAARAGCAFAELPTIDGSPRSALRLYEDAAAMAVPLARALARFGPDVVCHDSVTLGPGLAAEMCGIPRATLVVHPLPSPSRFGPPFGFGRPPARGPFRARDALLRWAALRNLKGARDALNQARAGLGLAPETRLDGSLSRGLVLVATLPSLEVPRPDWPETAHVIGPCLWDPAAPELPVPLGDGPLGDGPPGDGPPGDAPLVLIAASTAHASERMLASALAAVRALGLRAVVTTGETDTTLASTPGVTVAAFASHTALLPACGAVVCNGGHGIVARALTAGVPLVVVPGHGDQRENGYRLARAGAGVRVLGPTPARVQRALHAVLNDPRFAAAAARVRAEAATLNGPARAADLLEALAHLPEADAPKLTL